VLNHWTVCDEESRDTQASTSKIEPKDCNHPVEQSAHVANDTDTDHAVRFAIPAMRIHQVDYILVIRLCLEYALQQQRAVVLLDLGYVKQLPMFLVVYGVCQ
jgi:hypothetical protein